MKTLDKAKKTFTLMEARLKFLENTRLCPKCKGPSKEQAAEPERPQIGVKRAKLQD